MQILDLVSLKVLVDYKDEFDIERNENWKKLRGKRYYLLEYAVMEDWGEDKALGGISRKLD